MTSRNALVCFDESDSTTEIRRETFWDAFWPTTANCQLTTIEGVNSIRSVSGSEGMTASIERVLSGWVGKVVAGCIAALVSLRFGTGVYVWRETEKLERPSYEVLQMLPGGVELRKYAPYIVAETEASNMTVATREGFRKCAGYIFGKNKARASSSLFRISTQTQEPEKMAMTAPVRTIGGSTRSSKATVSFVMGSEYSLRTLPTPMDKNVKLRKVPSHTLAVRSFSGPPPKEARITKEKARIEKALDGADIKPSSDETLVYGYHDPFITPNFLRKNEVAMVVEGSP